MNQIAALERTGALGGRDQSDELQVLHGICHAFASATDPDEALESIDTWIKAALGTDRADAVITVPDAAGRLATDPGDAARADVRREVYTTKEAASLQPPGRPDDLLIMFPLVTRGECVGVLEIVAPREALNRRWDTLEAVVSQAAIVLKNVQRTARHEIDVETLAQSAGLTRDLVRARDPEMALQAAMDFCFDRFGLPVAAWRADSTPRHLRLAGSRGIPEEDARELTRVLGALPAWDGLPTAERGAVISLYKDVAGVENVSVVNAGTAVMLVGGSSESLRASLGIVGSLLEDVLRQLTTVAQAEKRSEELDLAIAWTAHEVRSPLLATKAAIERFLTTSTVAGADDDLLHRSRRELEQLAGVVDGLLRWSTGNESLDRDQVDLVGLTERIAESTFLESGDRRVAISSPERLLVEADADHLRGALANVVRNALAYSPRHTKVQVDLEKRGTQAIVRIQDAGPGIPEEDREAIFDPLVRGAAGPSYRGGHGLGLFIARRVIEAHGGTIWVESDGSGSIFHIQLPTKVETASPDPRTA
ncbi:MAG: ATP-binding protein [Actinomycetota bacterium]|nr:ATP-binding protein [Actinomycetota bacterium]